MTALTIDIIIGVILFLGFAHGLRRGFIVVLGTLVSGAIGVVMASWGLALLRAQIPAGPWQTLTSTPLVNGAIFLVCFLLATKLLGFVVSLIDSGWQLLSFIPLLGLLNRVLGGLAGASIALLALVVVTYVLDGGVVQLFGGTPAWYQLFLASRSYPVLHFLAGWFSLVLPSVTSLV